MPALLSCDVLDRLAPESLSNAHVREAAERTGRLLMRRAQHLDEDDERLLRLSLKYRLSVREIALLLCCNHGSIVRRLHRIKQRLCDPIVVALVDPACPLTAFDREMALDHFLRARSLRAISRMRGLPPREVRRRVLYVRGWAIGRRQGARATRAVMSR